MCSASTLKAAGRRLQSPTPMVPSLRRVMPEFTQCLFLLFYKYSSHAELGATLINSSYRHHLSKDPVSNPGHLPHQGRGLPHLWEDGAHFPTQQDSSDTPGRKQYPHLQHSGPRRSRSRPVRRLSGLCSVSAQQGPAGAQESLTPHTVRLHSYA